MLKSLLKQNKTKANHMTLIDISIFKKKKKSLQVYTEL